MDRNYMSQYGAYYSGQSASSNAPRPTQNVRTQTSRTSSDTVTRANGFIEQHNLYTKIAVDEMCNRGVEGFEFIPQSALREIWRNRLKDFLSILGYWPDDGDLRYIRNNLLKTLSILVAIQWSDWNEFHDIFLARMKDRSARRLDRSLPYALPDLEDISFLGRPMGEKFFNQQRVFTPIVIEQGENRSYPLRNRLPFIESERRHLGAGSFGTVTREVIAVNQFKYKHSETLSIQPEVVARKRMTAYGDFKKETKNLLDLNSSISRHDYIVGYIAIIVIGDDMGPKDFNILLPLADLNLEELLYYEKPKVPTFQIPDLLRRASNVADAIRWLHEGLKIEDKLWICCHSDLKLDNILVFMKNGGPIGEWKISDFGISTITELEVARAEQGKGRKAESLTVPGVGKAKTSPVESLSRLTSVSRGPIIPAIRPAAIYQAPEVIKGKMIGCPSDVWSFGCILFQILARGIGPGVKTLKELDKLRCLEKDGIKRHPTDYFFRDMVEATGYCLNPHVESWLRTDGSYGRFSDHEIVRACKSLIQGILKIDPRSRLKAREVNEKISEILNNSVSDSMSEIQSRPSLSRRTSTAEQSTQNSFRPSSARDGSHKTSVPARRDSSGSTFSPAPSLFESVQPMLVRSVTPPPEDPSFADSNDSGASFQPYSVEAWESALPFTPKSFRAAGSGQWTTIEATQYLPWHETNSSAVRTYPAQYMNNVSNLQRANLPLPTLAEASQHFVDSTSSLGNIQGQSPTVIDPRPSYSQSSSSSAQRSLNIPDHRSASHSSGRSHSLASSVDNRVHMEPVTCDTKTFNHIKHVVQALVSPVTKNLVFIAQHAIYICPVYPPYNYLTIHSKEIKWECGNLAGDFLAVNGTDTRSKNRIFRVYKVLENGGIGQPQSLRVVDPPLHNTHVEISPYGQLLFQGNKCAWLYLNCNDTAKRELKVQAAQTTQAQSESLGRICFNSDGSLAFTQTAYPGNLHKIKVWSVGDISAVAHYDYFHQPSDSVDPIKHIIPFPRSPYCILWAEKDKLHIFSVQGTQRNISPFHIQNLHALAITPDESTVIFIAGRHSKISYSKLSVENEGYIFGREVQAGKLGKPLSNPGKCAVAVQTSNLPSDFVTLLVAYSDGTSDHTDVAIRASG